MATAVSSATSYCSPTVFQTFYDVRQIGDLVKDDNTRPTATALLTDANVQKALDVASGEIESACLVAQKYTPSDLNTLTAMSLASLQKLCADLAFWHLTLRRFPDTQPNEAYKAAQEKLERLRLGERIFGLQENMDAGNPDTTFTKQKDIDNIALSTNLAKRLFGRRAKEERLGR